MLCLHRCKQQYLQAHQDVDNTCGTSPRTLAGWYAANSHSTDGTAGSTSCTDQTGNPKARTDLLLLHSPANSKMYLHVRIKRFPFPMSPRRLFSMPPLLVAAFVIGIVHRIRAA